MPGGVVFLVCIPTCNYEHQLLYGIPMESDRNVVSKRNVGASQLKPDLDMGHERPGKHGHIMLNDSKGHDSVTHSVHTRRMRDFVSMEKVLEEVLRKLRVEHVVWCRDKENFYYEVIFPIPSGDPCENCLHCLTETGIGIKMNSIVSVIPTQCTYSGLGNSLSREEADSCLAALGLIENSATNVVAAMLVSPLMGPVMSLTFGTIIADRNLQTIGLKSLLLGIFLSILFGFVFGLILGTTEMPWGYNDWPTDEMKGRGNYRSLWMGVLWALPSGTGVAVALLQGSNGPLIGVAISASLLPPVVNCGLFWALGCIWLIYKPIKMPHVKGESYTDLNSSYVYVYTDYLPAEFFCNGIISACLTIVNVICIFVTAIIVLKIKEVASPYTSTPELRRFWEHDIRLVRGKNNSRDANHYSSVSSSYYDGLSAMKQRELEHTLNEAVREAMDDETFRKVQRLSYGQHQPEEVTSKFGMRTGVSQTTGLPNTTNMTEDLEALDKLITLLLGSSNATGIRGVERPESSRRSQRTSRYRGSSRGYQELQHCTQPDPDGVTHTTRL